MGHERSFMVPADITDISSVQHLLAESLKSFGRLDLLFNNAGISVPAKPLEVLAFEEWQRVLTVMANQMPYG